MKKLACVFDVIFIFLLVCVAIKPAFAESGRIGQKEDGTPYRIDADGNEVIDYIAELEVAVENLNRRVVELEDELSLQQTASAKVAAIQPATVDAKNEHTPKNNKPLKECPSQIACDYASRDSKIKKLDTEVAELKRELQSKQGALLQVDAKTKNKEQELNKLTLALKEKEAAISQLKSEHQALAADLRKKLDVALTEGAFEGKVLKAKIAEREKEISVLKDDKKVLLQKINDFTLQNTELQNQVARLQKAQLAAVETTSRRDGTEWRHLGDARASFKLGGDLKRSGAVASQMGFKSQGGALLTFKNSLSRDVTSLRELLEERHKMAQRLGEFVPFPEPRSQRGMTLDLLAEQIEGAASISQLATLRGEITEIRGKIQGELARLRRN